MGPDWSDDRPTGSSGRRQRCHQVERVRESKLEAALVTLNHCPSRWTLWRTHPTEYARHQGEFAPLCCTRRTPVTRPFDMRSSFGHTSLDQLSPLNSGLSIA